MATVGGVALGRGVGGTLIEGLLGCERFSLAIQASGVIEVKSESHAVSRRSFLAAAGGIALGTGITQISGVALAAEAPPPLPWPYPTEGLDPDEVRKAAYCLYYLEGGCGHGSAQAIIDALADAAYSGLNPWLLLPRKLYSYGAGGVVGWGTICGALNGSIAVMDILGVHAALGNALVDYFCNTALPTSALVGWKPAEDGWSGVPVPLTSTVTHISYSPLCHNSVSSWAATAGVPIWPASSQDRAKSDHCAKLVGDIVARAVELMNDKFLNGNTPAAWKPPASYSGCYNCHTQPGMIPSQQGKMECQACHEVAPAHGTWRKRNRNGGG
jgi:hypothetical protein